MIIEKVKNIKALKGPNGSEVRNKAVDYSKRVAAPIRSVRLTPIDKRPSVNNQLESLTQKKGKRLTFREIDLKMKDKFNKKAVLMVQSLPKVPPKKTLTLDFEENNPVANLIVPKKKEGISFADLKKFAVKYSKHCQNKVVQCLVANLKLYSAVNKGKFAELIENIRKFKENALKQTKLDKLISKTNICNFLKRRVKNEIFKTFKDRIEAVVKSVLTIQRVYKGSKTLKSHIKTKKSVMKIQKAVKYYNFKLYISKLAKIQSYSRGMFCSNQYNSQEIQSNTRKQQERQENSQNEDRLRKEESTE